LGLADLFSKEGRSRRNLEKNIQRATEKHAQSVDRWKALETLRDDGSPEAIAGLLRRFSFNYDKTIEDEQEKEWVYQSLCAMDKKILPELRKYMRDSETLAWSLKILESVSSGDSFAETLRMLCEWNDNSYVRDPSKKIQLVHFLGEHRDPKLAELIVPYLEDIDEGVRFKAVEAAFSQGFREVVLGPLLKALAKPSEESRRIKVAIIDGLAASGWSLHPGEEATTVEKALTELGIDGKLDGQKRVKLFGASR
jgi:HEAT repeat protein